MDSCVAWHEQQRAIAGVPTTVRSLAALHKGDRGIVSGIARGHGAGAKIGDLAGSTIARRLLELGFVSGEHLEVVEEIRPGGDPIAVRIGSSIFALRRREAAAVLVQVEHD